MQIGWREFIKRRIKKASKYHAVGIEFGALSLHITTLEKQQGDLSWVKQCTIPIKNWQDELSLYVQQQGLDNTKCSVALSIGKYQILQVDKPEVEDSELSQALQWAVKEQLPGQEELILDYFDYPASPPNARKLNVVALPKNEIIDICNGIRHTGLELQNIGIEELATCNLFCDSNDAVITLFQEVGGQICLNIVKNNQLFFSRRLRGYENLSSFSVAELQMAVGDSLSVEVQRSMDYFESQLRQAPVKKLYIYLDSAHQSTIAELMTQLTLMPVETYIPEIKKADSLAFSTASFASLGAALGENNISSAVSP
ncbi:MAG: MSHA biogenesis protein MshI [Paraglaciecola sp.]|jgi:MSHA biogenesis protein MshI